jgi:hypothetical protein
MNARRIGTLFAAEGIDVTSRSITYPGTDLLPAPRIDDRVGCLSARIDHERNARMGAPVNVEISAGQR